jgi:hypothetical protein
VSETTPYNEPAFPSLTNLILPGGKVETVMAGGMSLRDYFAGHAPPMTNQWWEDTKAEYGGRSGSYAEAIAAWNYFYADQMLAARTGKGAASG